MQSVLDLGGRTAHLFFCVDSSLGANADHFVRRRRRHKCQSGQWWRPRRRHALIILLRLRASHVAFTNLLLTGEQQTVDWRQQDLIRRGEMRGGAAGGVVRVRAVAKPRSEEDHEPRPKSGIDNDVHRSDRVIQGSHCH